MNPEREAAFQAECANNERSARAFNRGKAAVSETNLDLYRALLRIVRQNAGANHVIGHDAIVAARSALARASGRVGQAIDWAKEKMP